VIIQLHSTPVSEPLAILFGVASGIVGYACASIFTADSQIRLWTAYVVSIFVNVLVGAKINLIMFDILALIVVRPLSAIAAAKILTALLS
jgi:hypothetical protein